MRTESRRWPSIGTATAAIAALGAVVIGAAWYVGDTDATAVPAPPVNFGGQIRLVAYDTCDTALADLKRAAIAKVGPWGLEGSAMMGGRGAMAVEDSVAAGAPEAGAQKGFSSTNVHEAAADEPDLVKTDGRRIVSVVDGKLRVVDVTARTLGATIALPGHATSVLLDGDRALVAFMPEQAPDTGTMPGYHFERGGLALVDLAEYRVLRTLTVDGAQLDARMVGSVARIVVRSSPRLNFTFPNQEGEENKATQRNREVIQRSTIDDWLPRYTLKPGGEGRLVDCAALSRPADYTGTALLSVLSVDLRADLTTQDTIAIAADGDTVYGTGTTLYVADDRTPRSNVIFSTADTSKPSTPPGPAKTAVHQFDIAQPGKPVYLASGESEGWLLNQYSLSEHDGRLRIATTTGTPMGWGPVPGDDAPKSESAVAVLERQGQKLVQVGRVSGLGKGEQIQSVRYMGETAYVVTFRRTDPLYAVDLSNPAAPKVTGELKITGFSAYLHPIGEGRLLGVGQEATNEGRTTGSQVSLFDISGPKPSRIAQYHEPDTYSMVEHDPHAFLYYAERDLVVIPMNGPNGGGAVLLRVTPDAITKIGKIESPAQYEDVVRTVIAGDALWTFTHGGVRASGLDTLDKLAWLPFG